MPSLPNRAEPTTTGAAVSPRRYLRGSSFAGVGLKPQHVRDILGETPALGFVEVHAENYMGAGGPPHRHLEAVRAEYPLSIHGVGLSLAGADPLDREHLGRLRALVDRYDPIMVSEHLAWSSSGGRYLNDLLPAPLTRETLERTARHLDQAQSALGRQVLLENPSTYLAFEESVLAEVDVLAELVRRTGCGLLLDVNNVFVSQNNAGRDPLDYLVAFPMDHVGEIHLAGHATRRDELGAPLLIDSHDRPVSEPVWSLFAEAVRLAGPRPTLIERDADIPAWSVLFAEAQRADAVIAQVAAGGGLALAS